MYETYELIEKYYDPDYAYHASVSKVMLYMTLRLAESTVLPFEPILFSEQLESNIKSFYEKAIKVSSIKMSNDVKDALGIHTICKICLRARNFVYTIETNVSKNK